MNERDLGIHIEGLLFSLGRPVSHVELAKMLGTDPQAIADAISALKNSPASGIVLVDDGKMVELRANPAVASVIEQIRRDEYSRDIGKAGLETLAAIIYRGPLSRSEVDFIRGVNSSQTIRTLLMRGLVRRVPNPRDERSFLYEATTELLAHMGVTDVGDMPEYREVKDKLAALEESYRHAAEA
jgi:segregation and condensation protein B